MKMHSNRLKLSPDKGFESGNFSAQVSLTSCAEAVGKGRQAVSKFLGSNRFKDKWGSTFKCQLFEGEGVKGGVSGVRAPSNACLLIEPS